MTRTASQNPDVVPIVLCVDEGYLAPAAVLIRSICDHSDPARRYEVIVFHPEGIDFDADLFLADTSAWPNVNVRLRSIDTQKVKGLFVRAHLTEASYLRLLLPDLLPQHHTALYLDADIICCADLAHLLDLDLGGHACACVVDSKIAEIGAERVVFDGNIITIDFYLRQVLRVPSERYVNSGVLLMNLEGLRGRGFTSSAIKHARQHEYIFLDQCIINRLLSDDMMHIGQEWNFLVPMSSSNTPKISSPRLAHFVGGNKPWEDSRRMMADRWWLYAVDSEFFSKYPKMPKKSPSGYRVARMVNRAKRALDYLRLGLIFLAPFGQKQRERRKQLAKYSSVLDHGC